VSYALSATAEVERLFATDASATTAIDLTGNLYSHDIQGNAGTNALTGGSGADTLRGFGGNDRLNGGTGADTLIGGTGDDTYVIDDAGDIVTENAGEGYDTVETSINIALPDNVERLIFTGAGPASLSGNAGNNAFVGGSGNDLINISQGGSDSASGGQGDDNFYLGGAFDASDTVDGGAGTLDSLGLQGVYAGLTLGANSLTGVELVALMSGTNTRFVDLGGALMSYNLTLNDGNVAAGEKLVFQANALRAGEDFTLNAAAETNGHIQTFAGFGTETITGGQLDDGFYFGAGRFGANDRVDGQGGFDSLGLQGDFSGANALTFGALQIVNIEIIALLSGSNTRFGNFNSLFSYSLTMNDANLAAGASMIVQGNALQAGEALVFDGSAETDGRFRIFGGAGNDSLTGGQTGDQITAGDGNDILVGLGGADQLTGAAGNDTFRYLAIGDSTAAASDQIRDFTTGDLIDLSALDANIAAGQQQFSFIGANAFTAAGQLRVTQTGGSALVEGDVNGDGIADFAISVTVSDSHQLALADFIGVGAGGQGGGASALDALLDSLPGHAALSSDPGAAAVGLYEHRVDDIGHAAFAPVLSAMPLETFL
jgi:Ca2+-binding RTX toxin-like protein